MSVLIQTAPGELAHLRGGTSTKNMATATSITGRTLGQSFHYDGTFCNKNETTESIAATLEQSALHLFLAANAPATLSIVHAPPKFETPQSTGHAWALQFCEPDRVGQALPEHEAAVFTVRLRDWVPPPQSYQSLVACGGELLPNFSDLLSSSNFHTTTSACTFLFVSPTTWVIPTSLKPPCQSAPVPLN